MSTYILSLVLTAAVLHAGWNLLSKKTQGAIPYIWLMYLASNILYAPILYFNIKQHDGPVYSPSLLWFSLSSAVLHLGYNIVLQKGYRSADLSIVYPLARGSGPLFSSIAAVMFLDEELKFTSTAGLLLIIAGVLLMTGMSFKKEGNQKIMAGVVYGTVTGLFIALYTFNDAIAIKSYAVSPLFLTLGTNLFCSILLLPFIASKNEELNREIRLNKWIIVAVAILSPAAYILVLEALKYAPLSVVAPAREISIVLGVFMGSKVFGEKNLHRRLVASVLILGGIVALSIG